MASLEIHQFPCLKDNYGVLVRDPATNVVIGPARDLRRFDHQFIATGNGWRLDRMTEKGLISQGMSVTRLGGHCAVRRAFDLLSALSRDH